MRTNNVLTEDAQGPKREQRRETKTKPSFGYEGGIEMSWVREGGCKRVARGEEGEKIRHQSLKGLVHQINLSDLPLPLCFSRF